MIAGHRGYQGIPYFREIEKLEVGDKVYITNPWETLRYRVESIAIIDPYDNDAVKIQDGKDMITLVTCHPYRSMGSIGMWCTASGIQERKKQKIWKVHLYVQKKTCFLFRPNRISRGSSFSAGYAQGSYSYSLL